MTELDLSKLILATNGKEFPALDPIIITMAPDKDLGLVIYNTVEALRFRLSNAGFTKYRQAIIANKEIIDFLRNVYLVDIRLVVSKSIPKDTAFILTASAGKRLLIHPPYKSDHSIMSWDEYYLRLARGEKLNILMVAPWAQAMVTEIKL